MTGLAAPYPYLQGLCRCGHDHHDPMSSCHCLPRGLNYLDAATAPMTGNISQTQTRIDFRSCHEQQACMLLMA
eukprot:211875-Chlamydomonas_euryale.AAC.1